MSAPARWVVVDDTDAKVVYEGSWTATNGSRYANKGNFGKPYNNTLHGTAGVASLSFHFKGTQGEIFGTTDIKNTSGVLDPTWECLIDGQTIGSTRPFGYTENNWPFCEWAHLSDSPHTVTLKASSSGQNFWFDRVQYVPSSSEDLKNATLLYNYTDPAIVYDANWEEWADLGANTLTNNATVKFNFTGSRLTWIGAIPTEQPHSPAFATYSIDGEPPIQFTLPGLQGAKDSTEYNYLFFQTKQLALAQHQLLVTHGGNRSSTPLFLSHLIVERNMTARPDDKRITTGDNSLSSKGTPIGAIIGGTLAALALLGTTFLVLYYLRKRAASRPKAQYKELSSVVEPFLLTSYPQNLDRQPYDPYRTHVAQQFGSQPRLPYPSKHAPAPTIGGQSSSSGTTKHGHGTSGYTDRSTSRHEVTSVAQPPSLSPPVTSGAVFHEDSGVRLHPPSPQDAVEYPPRYTPI